MRVLNQYACVCAYACVWAMFVCTCVCLQKGECNGRHVMCPGADLLSMHLWSCSWREQHKIIIAANKTEAPGDYSHMLASSIFCLAVPGNHAWTPALSNKPPPSPLPHIPHVQMQSKSSVSEHGNYSNSASLYFSHISGLKTDQPTLLVEGPFLCWSARAWLRVKRSHSLPSGACNIAQLKARPNGLPQAWHVNPALSV